MPDLSLPHPEPQTTNHNSRLNWLRAAVLGADDGIVSVSGIVVGMAGATTNHMIILTAGLAGLVAGAISMAAGEYVSVSSQRDSERALLAKERRELRENPKEELEELTRIYESRGLTRKTAEQVAKELHAHDPFEAHAHAELGIDPNDLTNPWHAAEASAVSFLVGAIIPLIAILLPPVSLRVPVTFIAVIIALAITGVLSARLGGASVKQATIRVIVGGLLAMIATYTIGRMFGVAGI